MLHVCACVRVCVKHIQYWMQGSPNAIASTQNIQPFLFSIELFQSHVSNQNFIGWCSHTTHSFNCMSVVLLLSSSSHYLFYIFFNLMRELENALSCFSITLYLFTRAIYDSLEYIIRSHRTVTKTTTTTTSQSHDVCVYDDDLECEKCEHASKVT